MSWRDAISGWGEALRKQGRFLREPRAIWAMSISGGLVLAGGAVLGILAMLPLPEPDVMGDDLHEVATFAMAEDFNRLTPRERISYLQKFFDRFRDFDEEDAAELSELIADLNFKLREQIEENMRRLAVDFLAESAMEYTNVPADEREAFLRNLLLELDKIGDGFSGRERDISDAERMAAMERQGKREQEHASEEIGSTVDPRGVNMIFNLYETEVSGKVPAVQRGAIARLMLDLTKIRRGQSINPRN
ncbi:MAG: hypothetical protein IT430_10655 [Phycisphaerales bacterium]|nr:hypothetical protein [Phycisphaerales bacterium]